MRNPDDDTTLEVGDSLILMGDLQALREIGKQI